MKRCKTCHKGIVKGKYCSKECSKRAYNLKQRYNLTPEDVYKLYKTQRGRCGICDVKGDIRELGYNNRDGLVIDHDHVTGEIRGLLCSDCNKGIGLLKDNRLILQGAIRYLSKPIKDRKEKE